MEKLENNNKSAVSILMDIFKNDPHVNDPDEQAPDLTKMAGLGGIDSLDIDSDILEYSKEFLELYNELENGKDLDKNRVNQLMGNLRTWGGSKKEKVNKASDYLHGLLSNKIFSLLYPPKKNEK